VVELDVGIVQVLLGCVGLELGEHGFVCRVQLPHAVREWLVQHHLPARR
jgi:hypothetical protein